MKNETIKTYKTLETITRVITEELDPCLSPDGCPEFEPWMACVGLGKYIPLSVDNEYWSFSPISCVYEGSYCGHLEDRHYFVDVRTAWAQEHFPEHCRIRNYQEPDAFEEFLKEEFKFIGLFHNQREILHRAYELGQSNA